MDGMNDGHHDDKELLEKIDRGELKPDPGEQYVKFTAEPLTKEQKQAIRRRFLKENAWKQFGMEL